MLNINNLDSVLKAIKQADSLDKLEQIHIKVLSKHGFFASEMKQLSLKSLEDKKKYGQILNAQKQEILGLFNQKTIEIKKKNLELKLQSEYLDLSLPVEPLAKGGIHPISLAIEQMVNIFGYMGFSVREGPEIDEDWYNFSALNIQEHHPARQNHDTFYLKALDKENKRKVLRTHTSNIQIRTMLAEKDALLKGSAIKIIAPGRTYRSDSDATHSPMFHQIEGLYVDKIANLSVPLLFSILRDFCQQFFVLANMPMRFRPSYFPFTSPSYEIDISCSLKGDNLQIGAGDKWLEILGAGIVNTKVLENCGIDSKKYAGLAFGIGIERLVMLKYGFKDLRSFFTSDIRWLQHYNFNPIKTPNILGSLD